MWELLSIVLIMGINLVISFANAFFVGRAWADVKASGTTRQKVMTYCGWGMSAIGFAWCYMVIAVLAGVSWGFLDPQTAQATMYLGYLTIIFPVLGLGAAIWADSMTTAARDRSLGNMGIAAWNTYAMAHNTYSAFSGIPDALGFLKDFFKGSGSGGDSDLDGDSIKLIIVILIVGSCLILGMITTHFITRWSAGRYSNDVIAKMNAAKSSDSY
jgi:hypothetical protein